MSEVLAYVLLGLMISSPVLLWGIYNWIYARGYCAALEWASEQRRSHHV